MYFFNKHKQKLFDHIFNSTAGHTIFQLFQFPLLLFQIEGYSLNSKEQNFTYVSLRDFTVCVWEVGWVMLEGGNHLINHKPSPTSSGTVM